MKRQSIEFVKKNQSVTYLVFSNEDAVLVGYFTLTIKPISVCADKFSNNIKRKLLRISELEGILHEGFLIRRTSRTLVTSVMS